MGSALFCAPIRPPKSVFRVFRVFLIVEVLVPAALVAHTFRNTVSGRCSGGENGPGRGEIRREFGLG